MAVQEVGQSRRAFMLHARNAAAAAPAVALVLSAAAKPGFAKSAYGDGGSGKGGKRGGNKHTNTKVAGRGAIRK